MTQYAPNRGRADVLILSSAIGSGHMRASAAIRRGIEMLDPSRSCLTVDVPREVSPAVERTLRATYLEALKLWPAAYGRLYRSSGGANAETYQHYLGKPGLRALERLVAATSARALVARTSTPQASSKATSTAIPGRSAPQS